MTPNNSFPSNQPTGQVTRTAETVEDLLLCAPSLNVRFESLDNPLPDFVNAALNVPLAVATTVANLVVLLAIRSVTSIRLPSKLLLCSLVITDLGSGFVVAPQFAAFLFLRAIYSGSVQCPLHMSLAVTGTLSTTASLLSLTAICVDRYAALFFHIKYKQIVTTRRVCTVLAFIWTFGLLLALLSVTNTKFRHAVRISVGSVSLLVISVVCMKIYRRLRAQQIQPQGPDQAQQQAGNTLNMARYRRTASAVLMVFLLFLICYLPFWSSVAVRLVIDRTALSLYLWGFSYSLVLLNSLLNPFVYCLRLPEIRTESEKQLRKLFCRSSSAQWTDGKDWNWAYSLSCYSTRVKYFMRINWAFYSWTKSGWKVNLAWHRSRIFNLSRWYRVFALFAQSLEYSVGRHTSNRTTRLALYPMRI